MHCPAFHAKASSVKIQWSPPSPHCWAAASSPRLGGGTYRHPHISCQMHISRWDGRTSLSVSLRPADCNRRLMPPLVHVLCVCEDRRLKQASRILLVKTFVNLFGTWSTISHVCPLTLFVPFCLLVFNQSINPLLIERFSYIEMQHKVLDSFLSPREKLAKRDRR